MTVKMVVLQGRPAGKALVFPDGIYYIGRGAECHIRPNSEWVSRQHCVLRVAGDVVHIRDLGSRNGTLVNGVLLDRERQLDHGDQVQVGPLVFEVSLDSETASHTVGTASQLQAGPAEPLPGDNGAPPPGSTEEFPALQPNGRGHLSGLPVPLRKPPGDPPAG
jgi:pSer/pThr/pTyr-binding forkhead associated (FHA) protein